MVEGVYVMSKEKQQFRCIGCLKKKQLSDLACFSCVYEFVERQIEAATKPLKEKIEALEKKLNSAKIVFKSEGAQNE